MVPVTAITSVEGARNRWFRGSPTFVVNDQDSFAEHDAEPRLDRRVYPALGGPAPLPSLTQLKTILSRHA